jgi:hypothetical protein
MSPNDTLGIMLPSEALRLLQAFEPMRSKRHAKHQTSV